jgi:hypothetical protein
MTVAQQVFSTIMQAKRPIARNLIQQRVMGSTHTVSKELTRLKKSGLVKEVKGNYAPTAKAKELFPNSDDLTELPFNMVSSARPAKEVSPILDWEYLSQWKMTRRILDQQEGWREFTDLTKPLMMFVLIYCIQSGQSFDQIEGEGIIFSDEEAATFDKVMDLLIEASKLLETHNED